MKIVFLTGSHPRHLFIANKLFESGYLSSLVIEKREPHVPKPNDDLDPNLKELFNLHFKKRDDSEKKFFGTGSFPNINTHFTNKDNLNSQSTIDFINKHKSNILISYGVHKLSNSLLNSFNGEKWNIHGGLSPWYRGNTTHFWPSYFLEPQMTGMTIHDLTENIDGGSIIHQNSSKLVYGDGIHDLACRSVESLSEELIRLIQFFETNKVLNKKNQNTSGKIWTSLDWRPEHLDLIYNVYDDKIVDLCLDGKIKGKVPKLYRQFD